MNSTLEIRRVEDYLVQQGLAGWLLLDGTELTWKKAALLVLAAAPGFLLLVPAASLGLAVVSFFAAALLSGFNSSQPRPNMLAYQMDASTGQAARFSVDENLDGYTSRFFSPDSEKSTFMPFPSENPCLAYAAWLAPDSTMPAPYELSDATLVRKTFQFP